MPDNITQRVNRIIQELTFLTQMTGKAKEELNRLAPAVDSLITAKDITAIQNFSREVGNLLNRLERTGGPIAHISLLRRELSLFTQQTVESAALARGVSGANLVPPAFAKKYSAYGPPSALIKTVNYLQRLGYGGAGDTSRYGQMVRDFETQQQLLAEQVSKEFTEKYSAYGPLSSLPKTVNYLKKLGYGGAGDISRYGQLIKDFETQQQLMAEQVSKELSETTAKSAFGDAGFLAGANVGYAGQTQQLIQRLRQGIVQTAGITQEVYPDVQGGRGAKELITITQLFEKFKNQIPGGVVGVDNLKRKLEELNITNGVVKEGFLQVNSGITKFGLEGVNQLNGQTQKATVYMDKFGNVLADTQKRFRTFAGGIARDTVEVLKWTIAIGLIYTPIRLFNQAIQESIELEAELVNVQITLDKSTTDINEVFTTSAKIAKETGSAIDGIIQGYSLAYAAVGGVADNISRNVQAQYLLRDSQVLATLANIDQTQALDTLVGALRQTDRELTDGVQILDSWVAVAKNSNVSINTLASTYAIVGSAADDAGISMDQLNAIAATLAETTKLSADETGNAIRGFISGFQQAKAEKVLSQYGIAVRTTSNDVRGFIDLLEEIVQLRDAGVLSQQDISEITNVVGGGYRRGAQLNALVENYNRVLEITTVSQNASGDAAEALALKLETTKTAITNAGNAFKELARAIGEEGGFLDGMKLGLGIVETFTNALELLVKGAGAATVPLLGLGASFLFLKNARFLGGMAPDFLRILAGDIPSTTQVGLGRGGFARTEGLGALYGLQYRTGNESFEELKTVGQTLKQISSNFQRMLGTLPLIGGALGKISPVTYIAPTLIAGGKALQGDWEAAGGAIAGAVAGGLIASATGIGIPVGAAIGSVAGSAIVDAVTAEGQPLSEAYQQMLIAQRREQPTQEEVQTPLEKFFQQRQDRINQLEQEIEKGIPDVLAKYYDYLAKRLTAAGQTYHGEAITGETLILNPELRAQFTQGRGAIATEISDEIVTKLEELVHLTEEQLLYSSGQKELPESISQQYITPAVSLQQEYLNRRFEGGQTWGQIAEQMANSFREEAFKKFLRGEIPESEYQQAKNLPKTLPKQATKAMAALELAGIEFDPRDVIQTLLRTTEEESSYFIKEIEQSFDIYQAIQEAWKEDEAAVPGLQAQLQGIFKDIDTTFQELSLQRQFEQLNIPSQEVNFEELTRTQTRAVVNSAQQVQNTWYDELARAFDIPPEQLEKMLANIDEVMVTFGEGINKSVYHNVRIDPNILRGEAEKIKDTLNIGRPPGIMDLRSRGLGLSSFADFWTRYGQWNTALERETGGRFEPDLRETTLIFSDGFKTLDLDMTLANLALQDLIDVNEKQLDGIYNLPGGATFYLPFTGYQLHEETMLTKRLGAGGGFGPSVVSDLPPTYPEDQQAIDQSKLTELRKIHAVLLQQRLAERRTQGPGAEGGYTGRGLPKVRTLQEWVATTGYQMIPRRTPEEWLATTGYGSEEQPATKQPLDFSGIQEFLRLFDPFKLGGTPGTNITRGLTEIQPRAGRGGPRGGYVPPTEQDINFFDALRTIFEDIKLPQLPTLSLQIENRHTSQLYLDGRILAEAIAPYLYERLLRFESSAGGAPLVSVIS